MTQEPALLGQLDTEAQQANPSSVFVAMDILQAEDGVLRSVHRPVVAGAEEDVQ
ncbi:hypothetical protein [Dactylosporangium sp. NPDC000521]|uniref:hypothetical protein n=1 Tax=Dactylosporangium sp. NPDC000521 TaxID=3363975 RepID=UPI0036C32A2B